MNQQVTVVARISVVQGQESVVNQALLEAVQATQLEDGCEFYHLYRDHHEANELVMIEHWRDEAALEAHLAGAAFVKLAAVLEGKAALQVSKLAAVTR
jgi:quinol monooxygenase YgiN